MVVAVGIVQVTCFLLFDKCSLFGILKHQFDGVSSLRHKGFIHLKPFLIIDLSKRLCTGDSLDISDRIVHHQ